MSNKIYLVKRRGDKANEEYMIEAANRAQALRVVAEHIFEVDLAKQHDIVRLVSDGHMVMKQPIEVVYSDGQEDVLGLVEEDKTQWAEEHKPKRAAG